MRRRPRSRVAVSRLVSPRLASHRLVVTLAAATSAAFTVDYVLTITAAPWPLDYVCSAMGLADVLTIAPWFIDLIHVAVRWLDSTDAPRSAIDDTTFLFSLRLFKVGPTKPPGSD